MARKSGKLNKENIDEVSNGKPTNYNIYNGNGNIIYTGIAGKGDTQNRLNASLKKFSDADSFTVTPTTSREQALKNEQKRISRNNPKHNKKGK